MFIDWVKGTLTGVDVLLQQFTNSWYEVGLAIARFAPSWIA